MPFEFDFVEEFYFFDFSKIDFRSTGETLHKMRNYLQTLSYFHIYSCYLIEKVNDFWCKRKARIDGSIGFIHPSFFVHMLRYHMWKLSVLFRCSFYFLHQNFVILFHTIFFFFNSIWKRWKMWTQIQSRMTEMCTSELRHVIYIIFIIVLHK